MLSTYVEPYPGLTTEALLHGKGWHRKRLAVSYETGEIYMDTSGVHDSRSPASIFHGTEMIP